MCSSFDGKVYVMMYARAAHALQECAGSRVKAISEAPAARLFASTALAAAQTSLFAGRRSTDRSFLLLQNLFCAQHLKGYAGTSAVYAVSKMGAVLQQQGVQDLQQRRKCIGEHWESLIMHASERSGCLPT